MICPSRTLSWSSAEEPRVGEIVLYKLKEQDTTAINRRRAHARDHMDEHRANANGVVVHVGNTVIPGDEFPMIITRVWGPDAGSLVNGTVWLDGSDTFWATSVGLGDVSGTWRRQP